VGLGQDGDRFPSRAGKLDCRIISSCHRLAIHLGDEIVRNPAFFTILGNGPEPAIPVPEILSSG